VQPRESELSVSSEPPESSPSKGWRGTAEDMHVEPDLCEYIDEKRDDWETIAEAGYPVSPVVRRLLDRRDRGAI